MNEEVPCHDAMPGKVAKYLAWEGSEVSGRQKAFGRTARLGRPVMSIRIRNGPGSSPVDRSLFALAYHLGHEAANIHGGHTMFPRLQEDWRQICVI